MTRIHMHVARWFPVEGCYVVPLCVVKSQDHTVHGPSCGLQRARRQLRGISDKWGRKLDTKVWRNQHAPHFDFRKIRRSVGILVLWYLYKHCCLSIDNMWDPKRGLTVDRMRQKMKQGYDFWSTSVGVPVTIHSCNSAVSVIDVALYDWCPSTTWDKYR